MRIAVLAVLLAIAEMAPAPTPSQEARELLGLAVAAAGGAEALQRHGVFAWHGDASVHPAAGQIIRIAGEWRVEPPDRAVVETFAVQQGPGSSRTMGIDNGRGWWRIGADERPMDADTLANERDQFHLYYLLRLTPLLGPDYTLTTLPADADGRPGLRVKRAGRRDTELYFDRDHRVVRMKTTVLQLGLKTDVPQELRLSGTVEAGGIKWPQRIQILQRGELFFDLELTNFRTLAKFEGI